MFIVYFAETGEMLKFFQFKELYDYTRPLKLYNGIGHTEILIETDIIDKTDIIAMLDV